MNTLLIMDIIIFCFGIFMLFVCHNMKKSGKIHAILLAEEEQKRCKNQKEFVDYIVPKLVVFSSVTMADAILGIVGELYLHSQMLNYAYMLIFFATFLWFGNGLKSAREKYCKPF